MGNSGSRDRPETVQFTALENFDEQPLLMGRNIASKSVTMVIHPLVKTSI